MKAKMSRVKTQISDEKVTGDTHLSDEKVTKGKRKITISEKLFEDQISLLKKQVEERISLALGNALIQTKDEFRQIQKDNKLFRGGIDALVRKVTRDRQQEEKYFYEDCRDNLDKRYESRFRKLQGSIGAHATSHKKKLETLEAVQHETDTILFDWCKQLDGLKIRQAVLGNRIKASLLVSGLAIVLSILSLVI